MNRNIKVETIVSAYFAPLKVWNSFFGLPGQILNAVIIERVERPLVAALKSASDRRSNDNV